MRPVGGQADVPSDMGETAANADSPVAAAEAGAPEPENAAPSPAGVAEEPVVLAQGERLVRVVSAPRRHAWGAAYVLRTILLVVLVFCVGSLVLTMVLNPGLTFEETVSLLIERASSVVAMVGRLFS